MDSQFLQEYSHFKWQADNYKEAAVILTKIMNKFSAYSFQETEIVISYMPIHVKTIVEACLNRQGYNLAVRQNNDKDKTITLTLTFQKPA